MTNKLRYSTAVHEAGHAVVMSALGLSVGEIEIGVDGDDTKGRTDLLCSDEHLPIIDRIAICVAGIDAQHIFECPTQELAGVNRSPQSQPASRRRSRTGRFPDARGGASARAQSHPDSTRRNC